MSAFKMCAQCGRMIADTDEVAALLADLEAQRARAEQAERQVAAAREALARIAESIEAQCKLVCVPYRCYKRHAPECQWDAAEEAREALAAMEALLVAREHPNQEGD